ncbi:MAG: M23 family metallopeptidase [Limnochordia bacterium]|nr:M23 family metallopeptidase [Limnochordia bacterium]
MRILIAVILSVIVFFLLVDGAVDYKGKGYIVGPDGIARPVVDGFDFPVGNRDGDGWGITGYAFLEWSYHSNSWHPGEDWNTVEGNDFGLPVYAVANGLVVDSLWNRAMGNIVQIEHVLEDGSYIYSQYAHLNERYVEQKEIVYRRQIIGTIGTGPYRRFAPHLHFELRTAPLAANAWPRVGGQAFDLDKLLKYWINPSEFIAQRRPGTYSPYPPRSH